MPPKPVEQVLTVAVKTEGLAETTEALKALTAAADEAARALRDLGSQSHGGIIVRAVGSLVHVEIKPAL